MKYLIGLVTVLAIIGAAYYSFENYFPKSPLGKDDAYKLEITTDPRAHSDTMRITNRTNMNLRLHVFYASDLVKLAAKYNNIIERGKSREYSRESYVINIWKSQLFDRQIQWTGEVWGDVEISGTENRLRISGGPKPPVSITNTVDEELKICAYNVGDRIGAVPLTPCWRLGKDRTVTWAGAPPSFTVTVFEPAALDVALVTQSHVPHLSKLVIRKEGLF